MDGIAVGQYHESNYLLIYNPRNKKLYEPNTYKFDPTRIPGAIYPSIKHGGGLFWSLSHDKDLTQDETYPPSTRIVHEDPTTHELCSHTVMDIPTDLSQPPSMQSYIIQFDDLSTISVVVTDMSSLISKPPINIDATDEHAQILPLFIQMNKKITYGHDGQYYKG